MTLAKRAVLAVVFTCLSGAAATPAALAETPIGPVNVATPFACARGPLQVETHELPEATIGMPYTAELAACNGVPPYKWKKIGKLPKGLKLSKTGVISGTPSKKLAPGSYSVTVQVSDFARGKTTTTISLQIIPLK